MDIIALLCDLLRVAQTINIQCEQRKVIALNDVQMIIRDTTIDALRACIENIIATMHGVTPIVTSLIHPEIMEPSSASSSSSDTEVEVETPRAKRVRVGHSGNVSYLARYGYRPTDDESTRIARLREAVRDVGFAAIKRSLQRALQKISQTNTKSRAAIYRDLRRL